ncbi:hypothetical protein ACFLRP_05700, partial [Bacteroidota bacterium]
MKKKLSLSLLAVVFILAGFGGGVYAVGDHQPAKGEKLVGVSQLGTRTINEFPLIKHELRSHFRITNPDCVAEINITKVSIIKGDETLIYEGPYIRIIGYGLSPAREVITEPMSPHEVRNIPLMYYMWTGEDDPNLTDPSNWMTLTQAVQQGKANYTVE